MVQGDQHLANCVEVTAQLQALAGLLEHLGGAVARQAPQQGGEDLRGEQGEVKEAQGEKRKKREKGTSRSLPPPVLKLCSAEEGHPRRASSAEAGVAVAESSRARRRNVKSRGGRRGEERSFSGRGGNDTRLVKKKGEILSGFDL